MGDIATLLGGGGALGAFAIVLVYLLSSNRADRRDAQDAIDKAEARADAAVARETALQVALDEARKARRLAEDRADLVERELARYRPGAGGGP